MTTKDFLVSAIKDMYIGGNIQNRKGEPFQVERVVIDTKDGTVDFWGSGPDQYIFLDMEEDMPILV